MVDVKRVFVGGLTPEITVDELKERFQRFCEVLDVQIKKKRNCESTPEKFFAYLNVKSTPENLQKCFSLYNKTKWKGAELRLQLAKENFLTRLEVERKDGFDVKKKKSFDNKDSIEYHNPFENLPDPSTHEMRGCVPGTPVPGEKNWVVGKYGRVLPVVFVRNKDKKKIVRVDPSKFCHNLKRIKEDDTTNSPNQQNNMTLQLDEKDSDIVKKRKGEFPEWKPRPSKRKNIDFEKLRELYMNNNSVQNCNNVIKEPDFEVVSGDISLSQVSKTFESNSGSDSDSYYASLKNPKSKSFSKKIRLTRPLDQSESKSDSEMVSNTSHNDIDISVAKGNTVKGFSRNDKKSSADTTVLKASISQQDANNAMSDRNKKPKIKPFGGTKILYETTTLENRILSSEIETDNSCVFGTGQLPSAKVKLNNKQKLQTHNSNMLRDINSKDKTAVATNKISNSINAKKVKEVPKHVNKITESLSKNSEDQDGNVSASSADTDEIINRAKSGTPSKTSNDFQSSFTDLEKLNSKTKSNVARSTMNSSLNLSLVDEFSSGLIKGEIPMDNESSCDNSADDSDESDFEKFALRESQRIKHMKEKELSRTLQNDTLFKIDVKNINDKTVVRNESSKNLLLDNSEGRNSTRNESEVDSNESVVDSNESEVDCSENVGDSNESVVDSNESEVDSNESEVDSNDSVGNSSESVVDSNDIVVDGNESEVDSSDNVVDSNDSVVDSNESEVDSNESVVDSNDIVVDGNESEVDSSDNVVDSNDSVVDGNESEMDSSDNVVDSNESEMDGNVSEVDSSESVVDSNDSVGDSSNSALEIDENDVHSKTASDSGSNESDLDTENSGSDSDTGGNDSDDENDSESSESCFNTDGNNSDSSGNDSDDENSDLSNKRDLDNCVKKQVQRDEKSQKQESLQLQPKQVTVETNKKTFAKENAKLTKEIKQLPKPSKKAQKEGKQDVDTNKKRLESVKQRQMENQAQKTAIKKALANIDNASKQNKKILFDDTDSDDVSTSNINKTSLLTEDDSDKDTSSSDGEITNSKDKEKNVPGLFDSSENELSDNDTDMFKIRPEFEGRSGQRRIELQSRYGNDDRFKLDERFIDSEDDEDDDDEEIEMPTEEDEKTKSLKILEEVIGTKIKPEKKRKMFRDVSALHFDPTREDHTQFEVKAKESPKKEKISKKKKKETKETEEDKTDELPEVGKDKFFEVSDSLKDTFKDGSKTTDKGFSLLSAFGSHGSESENDDKEEGVTILKHKSDMFPWQQKFDDDDSDSDMNDNNEDLENTQRDVGEEKTKKEPVVFSSTKSFFFFQENDDRITEGIKNFCRRESLEVIREKWLERRPYLVEAYRTKHKRLLRKTKMDKKQSKRPITPRRH